MQIKTTMRYYLTLIRMVIIKKSNNKFWRGCGEKGALLNCWWECKVVQPLWRTIWRFLKKLKIELPYDPAIPLLGIYLEKTIIQKDTCTPMFTAALFTIAKKWKQPKCPSTDKWIKKIWYRASLVAQWLRICLLVQGTRVRALVWEDPTCRGAAGPVSHSC